MLIKEEPVSPGVRGGGGGKGGAVGGGEAMPMTSSCEVCSSEPPVLPVAMVQSVLEGRGSAASMLERKSKRLTLDRWVLTENTFIHRHTKACVNACVCVCRVEVSDTVESVDMSLEELQQLLLRSHQQSAVEAGTSAVMDVSRSVVMFAISSVCQNHCVTLT